MGVVDEGTMIACVGETAGPFRWTGMWMAARQAGRRTEFRDHDMMIPSTDPGIHHWNGAHLRCHWPAVGAVALSGPSPLNKQRPLTTPHAFVVEVEVAPEVSLHLRSHACSTAVFTTLCSFLALHSVAVRPKLEIARSYKVSCS